MNAPKMLTRFRNLLLGGSLPWAFVAMASAPVNAAIIVFGDSLSDTRNTFDVTSGIVPPPVLPTFDPVSGQVVPVEAYFSGRFSNGPIWIDFLAQELGQSSTSSAFAGATTGTLNTIGIPGLPGLQQQIGAFALSGTPVDPEDLYVVWAGSNDYLEVAGQTDPSIPVTNIQNAILSLAGLGAKKFLVPNIPDLSFIPIASSRPNASQVSALSQQHNALLAQALDALQNDPSLDISVTPLDIFALIQGAVDNPAQFGFTNVTEACLFPSPLFFPPSLVTKCENPDEYVWWDSLHPSSRSHELVAEQAVIALQQSSQGKAVPEPNALMAMGLLGVALMGARCMRKQWSE